MIYREEEQSVLSHSEEKDAYFVEYLCGDLKMGKGVSLEFNKIFDVKNLVSKDKESKKYHWNGHGACLTAKTAPVFILINKENNWTKTNGELSKEALISMKEKALLRGVNKIYLPKFNGVKEGLIKSVFNDTEIEIIVCLEVEE